MSKEILSDSPLEIPYKRARQRLATLKILCDKEIFSNPSVMDQPLFEAGQLLARINDAHLVLDYYHCLGFSKNQTYDYDSSYAAFAKGYESFHHEELEHHQKTDFLIDFSGTCLNLKKIEEAGKYLDEAVSLLNEANDVTQRARLTCRSAYLQMSISEYSEAARLFRQSIQLFNDSDAHLHKKDMYFISLVYSGLGNVFELTADTERCKNAYLKAIEICERESINTRLTWYYLNAGKAFDLLEFPNQARKYYIQAINFGDDKSDLAKAGAYANLGHLLYKNEHAEKGLEFFQKAEEIYSNKSSPSYRNLAIINRWKGQLFKNQDDYPQAAGHFEKALDYAKNANDYKELASISGAISSLYAKIGSYKIAYEYQLKKGDYEKQLSKQINNDKIWEIEVKYASAKRKQEMEKLVFQAKALQLKALRAQMNPHFLFNALNSIQNFIAKNNNEEAGIYLSSFAKLMRKSLDYSELESISLDKEIEFLEHYLFINKQLRFQNKLTYQISVAPVLDDDDYEIPSMIIQPYVENAIEHGFRGVELGHISVDFDLFDDDTIRCIISDNGIGRHHAAANKNVNPDLQLHKSRGTQITLDRLSIMNTKHPKTDLVKIEDLKEGKTSANCGTKVTVLIPV